MNIVNDQKVILIVTDGMDPAAIKQVPKAQEFMKNCAYALDAKTVMPAITMPCHVSLFKSVDPEIHECFDNYDPGYYNKVKSMVDIFHRRDRRSAMFYSWGELRDLAKPGTMAYDCFISGYYNSIEKATKELTDNAIEYLNKNFTSFTFFHHDLIDSHGHYYGWMTDEYIDACKFVWDEIYRLVEGVADENTTVIIVSDHSGHDRDHGTEEDTTIPIMIRGKNFIPGTLLENASIKDVAPTILKILDLTPDEAWEGKALY
ncbi:MAG: alkaline phosphatase family protein [Clostridia bacterium]|nr:alkaline phosphatase family protein [Clostridia bacterium]